MPERLPIPSPEERPRVEERLRKMVQRWPQVSGCLLNPEPAVVEGIVQSLVRSTMAQGYPYCPCRDLSGDMERDREKICPCAFHQDEIATDGHCLCTLFVGPDYTPEKILSEDSGRHAMPVSDCVRQRWITLYTNTWCPGSRRARMIMDRNEIAFDEINIDHDADAAKRVETWNRGYRSVPTIHIRLILTEPSQQALEQVFLNSMAQVEDCVAYVTSWSPDARRALSWLEGQHIRCETVDVDQDAAGAERVTEWNAGMLSVPTLDVTLRVTEPTGDQFRAALGLETGF